MGMSASQARFLGLTARKSNVEFQGQQVNQQRTSLANESAGLFNQMLALQVPTPPSATDFYSMSYVFPGDASNEECQILTWGQSSATWGSYDVEVKRTINDVGVKTPALPVGSEIITNGLSEDGYQSFLLNIPDSATGEMVQYTISHSEKDVNGLKKEDGDQYVDSYSYQKNGRTYFIPTETLQGLFTKDESGNYPSNVEQEGGKLTATITEAMKDQILTSYYKSEKTISYETMRGVTMDTDDTGRFIGMTYSPSNNGNDLKHVDLTIEEIHDDQGYDAAMQEYNYKKMMYDRTITDINTRTEVIQQQDKTLELNLKQLDTEQEAVTQEIEAIQKVINKNVETSFKTFG